MQNKPANEKRFKNKAMLAMNKRHFETIIAISTVIKGALWPRQFEKLHIRYKIYKNNPHGPPNGLQDIGNF